MDDSISSFEEQGVRNDASFYENLEDSEAEVKRLEQRGFCHRISMKVVNSLFGMGTTISRPWLLNCRKNTFQETVVSTLKVLIFLSLPASDTSMSEAGPLRNL